ncbi:MAG TPA: hypothetical protein VET87_09460 [Rubrivivax sp.]|nr:hypothetical protein [Rubrivivax sp.]
MKELVDSVVVLAVPVIVVASLLLVAWLMTPALVSRMAVRRFDTLECKRGASWFTAALGHRPAATPPPSLETSAVAALPTACTSA